MARLQENESGKFSAREPRAGSERLEFGPHDRRMYAPVERPLREAAVGSAHQVLAPHELSYPDEPLSDQFRMLDDVGGVADDARHQFLSGRELDLLPDAPFVLVARVGALDEIGARLDFQYEVDHAFERHIRGVRPRPAAPADVIARAVFGNSGQRLVQHLDVQLDPAAILLKPRRRHHPVIRHGEARVVQLKEQAGVDDCFVLGAHRPRDRAQAFFVALVVLVFPVRNHARRRRHRKKALLHTGGRERGLEVRDVALQFLLAGVFDGCNAYREDAGRAGSSGRAVRRIELGVELREARAISAARERIGARSCRPALEAREALERVLRPADRFAELTVARNIDAGFGLAPHDLLHRIGEAALIRGFVVGLALLPRADEFEQRRRPDQAADVRGENALGAYARRGACSASSSSDMPEDTARALPSATGGSLGFASSGKPGSWAIAALQLEGLRGSVSSSGLMLAS